MFLHELKDVKELYSAVAGEKGIQPYLVEKDYWIMHALNGLDNLGFNFELKGGTSLSKGYGIIERFSEDLDIHIHPADPSKVKTGKNHDKESHIESRNEFFESLLDSVQIPGMFTSRDTSYDDSKMRNAGIVLSYDNLFDEEIGIKQGVLLEVGFDQTTPYDVRDISSWAYDKASIHEEMITDNRAKKVKCYLPEYTFVEKLQTISTKVRKQQETKEFGVNFLRHFYDIFKLLQEKRVLKFIGTDEYFTHKSRRFRKSDVLDLNNNFAFNLDSNPKVYEEYKKQFRRIEPLFMYGAPQFDEIYEKIIEYRNKM